MAEDTKTAQEIVGGHQQVLPRAQGGERQGPQGRQGSPGEDRGRSREGDAENQKRDRRRRGEGRRGRRSRGRHREADGPHEARHRRREGQGAPAGAEVAAEPVLPHRQLRRGEGARAQGAAEGRRHRRRLLASPEFSADIIKDVVLFSPMRSLVRVRTTSKGEYKRASGPASPPRRGSPSSRHASSQTNPAYGMSTRSTRTR
jgi:HK97 family phage major capsid protein